MASKALQRLQQRLEDVDNLIAAHAKVGGRGKGRKWRVAPLNRSALVLCSAHLEGFLEDLFSEAVKAILKEELPARKIPRELKLVVLQDMVAPPSQPFTRAKVSAGLSKVLTLSQRWGHPRTQIRRGDIEVQRVLEAFRTPKPSEIDDLFNHIGIRKILDQVRWRGTGPAKLRRRLGQLVSKRNDIVHGEVEVAVYKYDVLSFKGLVKRLGTQLDKLVSTKVNNVIGKKPW